MSNKNILLTKIVIILSWNLFSEKIRGYKYRNLFLSKLFSFKEFATEGYQLWMIRKCTEEVIYQDSVKSGANGNVDTNEQKCMSSLIQLDFVKSALTINPCMVSISENICDVCYILFQWYPQR